ncbi:F-box protein-like protein [Tanacetum coccineum]|uniref:F-box protein-like protein n=1 Tax=Tanacetum coccineum TaxID=301880 RepID=A0ABQ5J3G4_9ASTR
MSKNQANHARDNYAQPHSILINDDLLIEILIRLPILCMYLFTSVSKQWRRILTSPHFTWNRSQIHNLDPPAGLFVSHNIYPFKCDFVSLDSIIQSRKGTVENSFTLASTEAVENVKIVQSCNGNWKLCRDWFNFFSFDHFDSAIYWNGALHWLETEDIQDGYLKHYKLNIKDRDHPILTTIQIHQGLHWVSNFFEPLGNNLRVCITIQIPQTLHVEGKLFESRGCLLVVLRDYIGSREFTIYEMRKWCSMWSVRYLVNTDDFMNPLPEGWSIWSIVWSIVLGEREEDSCLVINLSGKVVEYNLISKTLHEIYDIGSN